MNRRLARWMVIETVCVATIGGIAPNISQGIVEGAERAPDRTVVSRYIESLSPFLPADQSAEKAPVVAASGTVYLPQRDRPTDPLSAPMLGRDRDGGVDGGSHRQASHLANRQGAIRRELGELERRMYRLSRPDSVSSGEQATRLELTLRRSRAARLYARMQAVRATLEQDNYQLAADQQQRMIQELRDLKDLLFAGADDPAVLMHQLQRTRDVLAQVAQQIEIARQRHHIMQNPGSSDRVEANGADAESTAQQAERLGEEGKEAARRMRNADVAQQQASRRLQEGRTDDAMQDQQQAIVDLRMAEKLLQHEEEQVRERLRPIVKTKLLEGLRVGQQIEAEIHTLLEIHPIESGTHEAKQHRDLLARRQAEAIAIVDSVSVMIDTTDYSIALPGMLRAISRAMSRVHQDILGGAPSIRLVRQIEQIERELAELMATIQRQAEGASPSESAGDQGKGGDGGQGKSVESSRLVTELRLLRAMQQKVLEETIATDALIASDARRQGRDRVLAAQLEVRRVARELVRRRGHELPNVLDWPDGIGSGVLP